MDKVWEKYNQSETIPELAFKNKSNVQFLSLNKANKIDVLNEVIKFSSYPIISNSGSVAVFKNWNTSEEIVVPSFSKVEEMIDESSAKFDFNKAVNETEITSLSTNAKTISGAIDELNALPINKLITIFDSIDGEDNAIDLFSIAVGSPTGITISDAYLELLNNSSYQLNFTCNLVNSFQPIKTLREVFIIPLNSDIINRINISEPLNNTATTGGTPTITLQWINNNLNLIAKSTGSGVSTIYLEKIQFVPIGLVADADTDFKVEARSTEFNELPTTAKDIIGAITETYNKPIPINNFIEDINNVEIDTLTTTNKTISGAIDELANSSPDNLPDEVVLFNDNVNFLQIVGSMPSIAEQTLLNFIETDEIKKVFDNLSKYAILIGEKTNNTNMICYLVRTSEISPNKDKNYNFYNSTTTLNYVINTSINLIVREVNNSYQIIYITNNCYTSNINFSISKNEITTAGYQNFKISKLSFIKI